MRFGISEREGVPASIEVSSIFLNEIKAKEIEDQNMNELKENMAIGKAQDSTLDMDGMLKFNRRISVPRVYNLIQKLLAEAHRLRYSIHIGVTKMF